ncbi:hypothetical protein EBB07_28830 [Paenibacillaceae bacterium]|nr:hypothetical protein EBB07_28830 [Paenibacillaceae bacterium]
MREIILSLLSVFYILSSNSFEMNLESFNDVYANSSNSKIEELNATEIKEEKNKNMKKETEKSPSNSVKPKTENVSTQSKNQSKMKTQKFNVSAYTAGYESTGKRPGHKDYGKTASGKKVKPNHTLACPKSMPFGTKVFIPYFDNTFVCEDRGGAITEGKLDVYMVKKIDAKKFGRKKNLEVIVYYES